MNFIFHNIMIFLFRFLKHYVDNKIGGLRNLCRQNLRVYSLTLRINRIPGLWLILFCLFIVFLIKHLILKGVTCITIFMGLNLNILILLYSLCCVKDNIFSCIDVMFIKHLRLRLLFIIQVIFIQVQVIIMLVLIKHFIFIIVFMMGWVIFIRVWNQHVWFSYEYIKLHYSNKFFNIFYIQKFFHHNLCENDEHVFGVIIHPHQLNQLVILTIRTFISIIYYKFSYKRGAQKI